MDRDPSRRAFLGALAAGTAALAGCRAPGSFSPSDSDDGARGSDGTLQGLSTGGSTGGDIEPQGTPTGRYDIVYEAVVPSVPTVSVYPDSAQPAQGSGFVYGENTLVTNEHVVADADNVYVRFKETGWGSADVVATDVYSDLAVLAVDELPASAEPLPFVDAEPPIGTEVVAIGNPFGYTGSMSTGIVSGVDRTLPAANGFSIPDAVQTDAAVNPGNSGGPLVSLEGEVVGVVNAGGGDNIGFAISAALTRQVVPDLLADGEYQHSYLGVRLQDVTPTVARANDVSRGRGVYIDSVLDGGPSDGVLQGSTGSTTVDGVQTPVGGDVVVAMDGTTIPGRQTLAAFLALRTEPGDTIDVTVLRDGAEQTVSVTLGARPDPS